MIGMRKIPFVLSGFALHLASHFGRSFKNHSYGYACLNDRPNCFASYSAQPDPSCNMRASLTIDSNGAPPVGRHRVISPVAISLC